jgi:hypothetical protein
LGTIAGFLSMSCVKISLAGFQVTISGRFWVAPRPVLVLVQDFPRTLENPVECGSHNDKLRKVADRAER